MNDCGFQIIDPTTYDGWDKLLLNEPRSCFFHTSEWAATLRESYGYQPLYWFKPKDGDLDAVLPMMEVDSFITGKRGISLPFTDDCPAIFSDQAQLSELFSNSLEMAKSKGWKYLEFRGSEWDSIATTSFLDYYGHELDLKAGELTIEKNLKSSVRRAIRKAESSGLTIEHSTTAESMKCFYSLQCKTRKKHGLPPQPYRFFCNIQKNILEKGMGFITTAFLDKLPIASSVFFHFENRVIYKFGASERRYLSLRANNLVMWSAIKKSICDGFEKLSFGKTAINDEGLRNFKLGWGASESSIKYFRYDLVADKFTKGLDRINGWYNYFFRQMPSPLSKSIGSLMYRHVA